MSPHITACKQYCLAAGATQGNIAYTQTVVQNTRTARILDNGKRTYASKHSLREHFGQQRTSVHCCHNSVSPFSVVRLLKKLTPEKITKSIVSNIGNFYYLCGVLHDSIE
jgi:hypothetical protein